MTAFPLTRVYKQRRALSTEAHPKTGLARASRGHLWGHPVIAGGV